MSKESGLQTGLHGLTMAPSSPLLHLTPQPGGAAGRPSVLKALLLSSPLSISYLPFRPEMLPPSETGFGSPCSCSQSSHTVPPQPHHTMLDGLVVWLVIHLGVP